MIITKEVKIEVKSAVTMDKLYEIGIKSKISDVIFLPIEKLWKGSHIKIEVACDICNQSKFLSFRKYWKNYDKYSLYTCIKCSHIKNKKTNLEKYGVEYYIQTKECKEKVKETNLEKYGVEYYTQTKEYLEKVKETNLEKYGVEHYMKSHDFEEKTRKTNSERYSVEKNILCLEIKEKIKQTNLERYGVEYPINNPEIKKKSENTKIEKYGDKNYNNREKYKETVMEKYGVEHTSKLKSTTERRKETNLIRFGFTSNSTSETSKRKLRETNLERYGVEYPMQVEEFFNKQQKSAFKIQKYKDTQLYYQGSYEKDFLFFCENNGILERIIRPKPIEYLIGDKKHKYYPDYLIDDKNLIIEIKSSYTFNKWYDINMKKQQECLVQGYNFIFIIDKNYDDFLLVLNH